MAPKWRSATEPAIPAQTQALGGRARPAFCAPSAPSLVKVWTKSANIGPNPAKVGQIRAQLGQQWATVGHRPAFSRPPARLQRWPEVARWSPDCRPSVARLRARLGRHSARRRPSSVQHRRSSLGRTFGQGLARCWAPGPVSLRTSLLHRTGGGTSRAAPQHAPKARATTTSGGRRSSPPAGPGRGPAGRQPSIGRRPVIGRCPSSVASVVGHASSFLGVLGGGGGHGSKRSLAGCRHSVGIALGRQGLGCLDDDSDCPAPMLAAKPSLESPRSAGLGPPESVAGSTSAPKRGGLIVQIRAPSARGGASIGRQLAGRPWTTPTLSRSPPPLWPNADRCPQSSVVVRRRPSSVVIGRRSRGVAEHGTAMAEGRACGHARTRDCAPGGPMAGARPWVEAALQRRPWSFVRRSGTGPSEKPPRAAETSIFRSPTSH